MKCKSLLKVISPDTYVRLQVGNRIVAEEFVYEFQMYTGTYEEYLEKKVKRVYSIDEDIIRVVLVD